MRREKVPGTTQPTELAGPQHELARLHALDILRGLALAGMILVHFHQRVRLPAAGYPEQIIGSVVWMGVEQKAWAVFAFLFGVGFAALLRRLESRGTAVVPFYLRRLAGLAAFGIAVEAAFGFDVLLGYAIWGVPLLLVRRWSTPMLLLTAALAVSVRPLYYAGRSLYRWGVLGPDAPSSSGNAAGMALWEARREAAAGDDFLTLLQARLDYMGWVHLEPTSFLPDSSFGLFIIGLLALRHGVFDEPRRHVRLIAAWMIGGFAAWATSWFLLARIPDLPVPGLTWTLRYGLGLVQDQWLALTYIGAVVLLLAYRPVWTPRLSGIGLVGRMALTNYVLQAAVIDYLSSGYGLGLKLRPYAYASASVLLFGALLAVSWGWLARHRFGPLEWIWRTITYWRVQPLRRAMDQVPQRAVP
ncbi:MAG: DUF418 domain-containing protein [Luteimonas sp.]